MTVIATSEPDLVETYCKHCKNTYDLHLYGLHGCSRYANIDIFKEIDRMRKRVEKGPIKVTYRCKYFEAKE